ncbi:unnamed protein product, partial [Oppiella nova]
MRLIAIIFSLYVFVSACYASKRWPNHDISTLKLLQLVHRHGERAPTSFPDNDPYKDTKYWVEGVGELTTKGKYRLYKLGEFIRQEYSDYLGDKYSPREVYVRSSITDRCIESTSSLLAGAYPPKQPDWQWNNGTDAKLGLVWQPFPIETFMPHSDDLVCNEGKPCAAVNNEMTKIYNRPELKEFVEKNKQLYENVSKIVGKHIKSIGSAASLYDILKIETDHNYFWNHSWTKEEETRVINELYNSWQMQWRYDWDSPVIQRLRGGGLTKELNANYQKVVDNRNDRKLYVYSTHDAVVAALMKALNISDGKAPPFGFGASNASKRWPDHDISTLKLLQLVHRHGERPPYAFPPKDTYSASKYWVEGVGELTTKGKYRLYKLGEFIRQEYNDYLGDKYSPREVYVRSSITDRCIESTSSLLAGAYPPKQPEWQWNKGEDAKLGLVWQPFPIQTFMPHEDDLVCNQDKECPIVDKEKAKIYERPELKKFVEDNKELYANMTKATGWAISTIADASTLYDTLKIESDHNYFWNSTWTKEEEQHILDQLLVSRNTEFKYDWDSPIIKRLRGGGLAKELTKNFNKVVNKSNEKKLYVYSTHDTTVAALINAMNFPNHVFPPFGATLLLELHQNNKTNDYFVRAFYQNETTINEGIPHALSWGDCANL